MQRPDSSFELGTLRFNTDVERSTILAIWTYRTMELQSIKFPYIRPPHKVFAPEITQPWFVSISPRQGLSLLIMYMSNSRL